MSMNWLILDGVLEIGRVSQMELRSLELDELTVTEKRDLARRMVFNWKTGQLQDPCTVIDGLLRIIQSLAADTQKAPGKPRTAKRTREAAAVAGYSPEVQAVYDVAYDALNAKPIRRDSYRAVRKYLAGLDGEAIDRIFEEMCSHLPEREKAWYNDRESKERMIEGRVCHGHAFM